MTEWAMQLEKVLFGRRRLLVSLSRWGGVGMELCSSGLEGLGFFVWFCLLSLVRFLSQLRAM